MKTLQFTKIGIYAVFILILCILALFTNLKIASAEDISDYGASGWWMMNSEFVGYDNTTCGPDSGVIQISLAEHDSGTLLTDNIPTWKVEVVKFVDTVPIVIDEWTSTSSTNTSGKLCFLGNTNYIGVTVNENGTYYELNPVYQNIKDVPDENFYGEFYRGTVHLLEKSVSEQDLYPVEPFYAETATSPFYSLSTIRVPEGLYGATSLTKSKLYIQSETLTTYSHEYTNDGTVEPKVINSTSLSDGFYWWRFYNSFNGTLDLANGRTVFDSPVSSVTRPTPFTYDSTPPAGAITMSYETAGALINADFNINVQDAIAGMNKVTFYINETSPNETENTVVFNLDGGTGVYSLYVEDMVLEIGPSYEYYIVAIDDLGNILTTEPQVFQIEDPTPDLSVQNIYPVTGYYNLPSSILFKAKVSNRVGAVIDGVTNEAGMATVDIDWNSDGSYDTYFVPNPTTSLGTFASGESKDIFLVFSAPPSGTHKYRFNVDVDDLLTELDETNNSTSWKAFYVSQKPIAYITSSSYTITVGTDITLYWAVLGPADYCYPSWSDQTTTSGSEVISGLTVGQHTYSLYCTGSEGQSNTTQITIHVKEEPTIAPDLVANPVVLSHSLASTSAVLTFGTGAITNVGTGDAGPHHIGGFYIDANEDGVSDFVLPLGKINATTSVGGFYSTSTTWDLSAAGIPVGTYYVSYIVDWYETLESGEINELPPNGENNNFSGWSSFEIADFGSMEFTTLYNEISYGDDIRLNWHTENILSCVASGDWSGDKQSYEGWHNEVIVGATPGSHTYTLTCTDVSNMIHEETITVDVITPADLFPSATPFHYILSDEIDPELGTYDTLSVLYNVRNNGDNDVDVPTKVEFKTTYGIFSIKKEADVSYPIYSQNDAPFNTSETDVMVLATDVPADQLINVQMTVDSTNVVNEGSLGEGNNTAEDSVILSYPDPGLSLESTPASALVPYEGYVDLNWDINGSMYMDKCLLFGKNLPSSGKVVYDANALDESGGSEGGSNIITGSVAYGTSGSVNSIGPLTNKTQYLLQCTAIDSTVFERTIWIDVIPKIEEI